MDERAISEQPHVRCGNPTSYSDFNGDAALGEVAERSVSSAVSRFLVPTGGGAGGNSPAMSRPRSPGEKYCVKNASTGSVSGWDPWNFHWMVFQAGSDPSNSPSGVDASQSPSRD